MFKKIFTVTCCIGMATGAVAADDKYLMMTDFGLTGFPGAKKTVGRTDNTAAAGVYQFEINLGTTGFAGAVERWDGIALFVDGNEPGEPSAGEGVVIALRDNAGVQGLNILRPGTAWVADGANFAWNANTWYTVKVTISDVQATTVDVAAKIWLSSGAEPGSDTATADNVDVGTTSKTGMLLIGHEGTSGAGDWGIARFDTVSWGEGTSDFSSGLGGWSVNSGNWTQISATAAAHDWQIFE